MTFLFGAVLFGSKIYRFSPVFVQEILLSLRCLIIKVLREGPLFKKKLRELKSNEKATLPELNVIKQSMLKRIQREAVDNTEAYSKFSGVEFNEITFTTKNDLAKNVDHFVNKRMRFKIKISTGGTTGTPIDLKTNLTAINEENAHVWRQLEWAGYQRGERRAWLRGETIVPVSNSRPPFWRRNFSDNMLMLSSYHLKQGNCAQYINELQRFNPVIIQAYPSCIVLLARYLENENRVYEGDLRSILTSSETLADDDKELLERIFKCKVFDWYGLSERVVAVGTCSHGSKHVIEDYGYLETWEDSLGNYEMVGTGFNNKTMPLLRYRTGDSIEFCDEKCPCGLAFRKVKRIKGRIGDYLLTDNGAKVTILNHIPKGVEGLIELQLIQNHKSTVDAHVVTSNAFGNHSEQKLISNVKKHLGDNMGVKIIKADHIKRTSSGKFRQAICNLE